MRAANLWVLVAVLACSDEGERPERLELEDDGALCVRTDGGELAISVVVNGCASGCTNVIDAACEVQASGAELVVHSSIVIDEWRGERECPSACVPIGASCAPLPIVPGNYRFHYGGSISRAELPTEAALLLGSGAILPELQCPVASPLDER